MLLPSAHGILEHQLTVSRLELLWSQPPNQLKNQLLVSVYLEGERQEKRSAEKHCHLFIAISIALQQKCCNMTGSVPRLI